MCQKMDLYYSASACAVITGSVDTLGYLPHFLLLPGHSDTRILFSDFIKPKSFKEEWTKALLKS